MVHPVPERKKSITPLKLPYDIVTRGYPVLIFWRSALSSGPTDPFFPFHSTL